MAENTSFHVTTQGVLDGARRRSQWQDVMSPSGTVTIENEAAFQGEIKSRVLGELRTMRVVASPFRLIRDLEITRRTPRDYVCINLVVTGKISGSVAERKIDVNPGEVLLSRLTNEIDVTLPDAEWLALLLPRATVEKTLRWLPRWDGTIHRATTMPAIMLGGLLSSLCALPEDLRPRDVSRASQVALETLTTCLGGNVARTHQPDRTRVALAPMIGRFIVRKLSDSTLSIDTICQEFGISRAKLHREMGDRTDIATLIRRMRLEAIARDIASHDHDQLSLAAIAERYGMPDERTFRRAFQREFGFKPSDLREGKCTIAMQSFGVDLQQWFLSGGA